VIARLEEWPPPIATPQGWAMGTEPGLQAHSGLRVSGATLAGLYPNATRGLACSLHPFDSASAAHGLPSSDGFRFYGATLAASRAHGLASEAYVSGMRIAALNRLCA
jgi:hypothetical protein